LGLMGLCFYKDVAPAALRMGLCFYKDVAPTALRLGLCFYKDVAPTALRLFSNLTRCSAARRFSCSEKCV
jgi:hypothetical protein